MRILSDQLKYPEGPVAMSDGSAIVVEIARQTLSRVAPNGRVEVIAEIRGGPNGAAMGPNNTVFVCNNGGMEFIEDGGGRLRPGGQNSDYVGGSIDVVDLATGSVTRMYDRCGANMLRGPNDLVFDGEGGFWFTDMGKRRTRDMDLGFVYWCACDGSEIKEVIFGLFTPNGIALSPDGKTLYVAETMTGRIWSWPIVGRGEVQKQPWPAMSGGVLYAAPGGRVRFDGLAVAASGAVYAATLDQCAVLGFTGNLAPHLVHPVPDLLVTNLCFGAADMRECFVTLSHEGKLVAFELHEPGLRLHYQA